MSPGRAAAAADGRHPGRVPIARFVRRPSDSFRGLRPRTASGMAEKHWYLKRCNLFDRLAPDELSRLEGRARLRKYARGNAIYLPADAADGVLLLAEGRVKICSFTGDGKQTILAFIEPGEMFGELALLQNGDREEFAEALVDSTVVLLPADLVQGLMEENAGLALGVTKLIGLRRRRIERRLKYLLFRSNRERLVHLLLELSEQYGRRTPDGVELSIRLAHQDLASVIGSTRETVTVLLGELQAEGLLRVGRRKITVRKLEALAASVEQAPPVVGPADDSPQARPTACGGKAGA